jgi:diacylglycerol kinase family enzyme
MKISLIINPKSGNGRSRRISESIIKLCREQGLDVHKVYASTYKDIKDCSLLANSTGNDVIVAVGGDGTINAVLNGFYNSHGKKISHSKLGVIYTGTSPDFCKSYGIPLDYKSAIKNLVGNKTRKIYPGKINMIIENGSRKSETRYFACCANIGIGAGIARDSNRIRKYTGDMVGTFISLVSNIIKFRSHKIFIEVDRNYLYAKKVVNISVGRTPYIASGIKISNKEILDCERFYILVASDLTLRKLPGLIRQIYSGKIINKDYLQLSEGQNIMLNSDNPDVEVEFDGDPVGFLPCRISPVNEPIELVV